MLTDNNELDLLAFRYIADELADDERDAFEIRLAGDQAAREAVARAVEIGQAAMAALESPALVEVAPRESSSSSWYTRILWMTSGAAACLAALVGYQVYLSQSSVIPSAPATSPEIARLANAWSDAQESLRADRDAFEHEASEHEATEADLTDDSPSSVAAAPSLSDMGETPSWMLAAVGVEPSDDDAEVEKPAVPDDSSN